MKTYLKLLSLLCILSFLAGCKDDEKPKGEFASGVWVINEGNFKKGNGSVSFYNPITKAQQADLFGTKNPGKDLGDVVQSISIDGDHAYVIVNNDNKVEVVSANTFASEYTLTGVKLPRYFTVYKGKGYLTEWVSFTDSSRVSIIDLDKHTVTKSINTGSGAENIIAINDKLYISNNFSSSVAVIDIASNKLIKTIEVGGGPGGLVVDKDNKLWVICSGDYKANNGALYKIDPSTNAVVSHIDFALNLSAKLVINKTKDQLFLYDGTSVYSVSTSATSAPTKALIEEKDAIDFYGIGYDAANDVLYLGDDSGFIENGVIFRYKTDGSAIDHFSSEGIAPNGFIFR